MLGVVPVWSNKGVTNGELSEETEVCRPPSCVDVADDEEDSKKARNVRKNKKAIQDGYSRKIELVLTEVIRLRIDLDLRTVFVEVDTARPPVESSDFSF